MPTIRDLALFYKALGDETRLQLVALLARQRPGHALCVGRLAHDLGVTPSAVSQHLRVLKDLGLVQAHRQGYRLHYYLDAERLSRYQALARHSLGLGFAPPGSEDAGRPQGAAMCCADAKEGCRHTKQSLVEGECALEPVRARHTERAE